MTSDFGEGRKEGLEGWRRSYQLNRAFAGRRVLIEVPPVPLQQPGPKMAPAPLKPSTHSILKHTHARARAHTHKHTQTHIHMRSLITQHYLISSLSSFYSSICNMPWLEPVALSSVGLVTIFIHSSCSIWSAFLLFTIFKKSTIS